jgi:hypothetical protein
MRREVISMIHRGPFFVADPDRAKWWPDGIFHQNSRKMWNGCRSLGHVIIMITFKALDLRQVPCVSMCTVIRSALDASSDLSSGIVDEL